MTRCDELDLWKAEQCPWPFRFKLQQRTVITHSPRLHGQNMAAASQVAREAWHIFVSHTRADLYQHMDSVLDEAQTRWRSYPGNRGRFDVGPFQLHTIDWYLINRNWDGWLQLVYRWAEHSLKELHRMVFQLDTVCGWAQLVFRGRKEIAMDENLYLALEETKNVLGCFCRGWEIACRNMTLLEWCAFGGSTSAAARRHMPPAAFENPFERRQPVSDVAPL